MLQTVSVVIPTRNRLGLLRRTLDTVRAQRGVDLEIIVVDDASTDETAGALDRLGDPRVRVVRRDLAVGVSVARNVGIARATGEWVALIDDDDLWAPNKLSDQLAALRAGGADWAYAGLVSVDDELSVRAAVPPVSPEAVRRNLLFWNAIPAGGSTIMARRTLLEDIGGYDPTLRLFEDWDLCIRLAAAAPCAVAPAPLVAYVTHRAQSSLDTRGALAMLDTIDRRYRALRGGRPINWGRMCRWVGWSAARSGDRTGALRAYARGARSGDAGALPRAAAVLAAPRLAVRFASPTVNARWARGARAWLAAVPAPCASSAAAIVG